MVYKAVITGGNINADSAEKWQNMVNSKPGRGNGKNGKTANLKREAVKWYKKLTLPGP